MSREPFDTRSRYPLYRPIQTRWSDNDAYGHVNNVVYYAWFDTAINGWLIDQGVLDIAQGPVIGLVVETGCRYNRSISYPEPVEAGIRVAHIGRSSVRYEVGLFTQGHDEAAAAGFFIHVYVDRQTMRPVPLPDPLRACLETIRSPDA
jgi:acyl-CoA thioester hydrolase